ncbi:MAG TPA: hypothetical protein VHW03_06915, partial [Chthoniobacterales bacterium]|nr:hypothetical protein [Chthoniobacterales bacterium]
FKTFGQHLNAITAPDSSLQQSLNNIRDISNQLKHNNNIEVTLSNFRASSEELKSALDGIAPDLKATLSNTKDLTATLRTQPWRLIYPTTKKYPNESATPTPSRRSSHSRRR